MKDIFPDQSSSKKDTGHSVSNDPQGELLEAQRAVQEANVRLQNARREKWLPEMLESLQENVKAARQLLEVLQQSAQTKGTNKQLDKRWLSERQTEETHQ